VRYLSVCSGIEAATVAWHPLGWKPAAFSEIEAFPRAVLAHHYPTVPLHGDFTTIKGDEYGPIDLLVGGTPCQDFSVAGLRAGITGDRGNLTLEFLRLAARVAPRWIVWENVPGVLSSDGGRALGAFLGGLGQLGYGFAYRILDAQYFGLAQRRQRVFVVGCLGDWRRAAAVLFERESLQGHPAPRREAREGIAARAGERTTGGGWPAGVAPTLNAAFGDKLGLEDQHALNGAGLFVAHALRAEGFDASEDGTGRGTPLVPVAFEWQRGATQNLEFQRDMAPALVKSQTPAIVFDETQITSPANYSAPKAGDPCHPLAAGARPPAIAFSAKDHGADAGEISPTLRSGSHRNSHANGGVMPAVAFDLRGREGGAQFEGPHDTANMRAASGGSSRSYVAAAAVRRLTPRECERLQGFPDDYTLVPIGREPRKQKKNESDAAYAHYLSKRTGLRSADGPRYKALGNSMAVPVMAWIGRRIAMVEALEKQEAA